MATAVPVHHAAVGVQAAAVLLPAGAVVVSVRDAAAVAAAVVVAVDAGSANHRSYALAQTFRVCETLKVSCISIQLRKS